MAVAALQMWREIEGEHIMSQSFRSKKQGNGSDSECVSTTTSIGNGSENGDDLSQTSDESANQGFSGSEDNNSVISEQSVDLGEMERERVRQTFQEWMSTGPKGHSSYGFGLNNRTEQWLGENERDRVRIIREWAQKTTQTRNICRSSTDEVGSLIEQARDGLVINEQKIGERRPIRRLCGRQTLLDLLQKAQNERRREIRSLSEQRPVSNFVHRNRIQVIIYHLISIMWLLRVTILITLLLILHCLLMLQFLPFFYLSGFINDPQTNLKFSLLETE